MAKTNAPIPQAKRLLASGRPEKAIEVLQKALKKAPKAAALWAELGSLLCQLNRWNEAYEALRRALQANPGQPVALFQLGEACVHLGKLHHAADFFRCATQLRPQWSAAWRNLGVVQSQIGADSDAFKTFLSAYLLEPGFPGTAQSVVALAGLPEVYNDAELHMANPDLRSALIELFDTPGLSLQDLAPMAGAQVRATIPDDSVDRQIHQAEADPLLHRLLRHVINVDLGLEKHLVAFRSWLLSELRVDALDLMAALALQCFNNEYIWPVCEHEQSQLFRLEQVLAQGDASLINWVALSMYRPLHSGDPRPPHDLARACEDQGLKTWWLRTVQQPQRERELAQHIPVMTPITQDTSVLVRQQYEENPFPRWTVCGDQFKDLADSFRHWFPESPVPKNLSRPSQILVAGCGTGLHPTRLALANPKAHILAVDLSRASLAFAERMRSDLGVTNIEFGQADILHLKNLEQLFDHIECVGVLHHMANPLEGWRILKNCLRPQGTMRLGLYSERARQAIVSARQEIARRGIPPTLEGIREFRRELLTADELGHLAQQLVGLDLFSTSMLRDLLFHVSEQRYTCGRLEKEIEELGLRFVGFEQTPAIRQAFAAAFPQDRHMTELNNWHQFEQRYPHTFKNMYLFWCSQP